MVSEDKIGITVFFPCHNEQDNVEQMTRRSLEVLAKISDDYEVIIVNDGSKDDTGKIADRLARQDQHVKVIHHAVNRGYGGALQSGFHAASKQWVFYTDGDCQFDIGELPAILDLTEKYDIVSCYRLNRKDNMIRRINAWAWGALVRSLFKLKVKDIDCAFKLYRREIFDHIEMHSEGALIDTEILARAQRAGYRITQRGVHHYPRTAGKQSGANIRVVLRAFKELFRLRRQILTS